MIDSVALSWRCRRSSFTANWLSEQAGVPPSSFNASEWPALSFIHLQQLQLSHSSSCVQAKSKTKPQKFLLVTGGCCELGQSTRSLPLFRQEKYLPFPIPSIRLNFFWKEIPPNPIESQSPLLVIHHERYNHPLRK